MTPTHILTIAACPYCGLALPGDAADDLGLAPCPSPATHDLWYRASDEAWRRTLAQQAADHLMTITTATGDAMSDVDRWRVSVMSGDGQRLYDIGGHNDLATARADLVTRLADPQHAHHTVAIVDTTTGAVSGPDAQPVAP